MATALEKSRGTRRRNFADWFLTVPHVGFHLHLLFLTKDEKKELLEMRAILHDAVNGKK